jgi:DNA-binding beta-propeller fold protein YncE
VTATSNRFNSCGPIVGGDTGLSNPQAAAMDASGNLYVANVGNNSISVYANLGSNAVCGDLVPVTTLYGMNTGLAYPISLAIGGPTQ